MSKQPTEQPTNPAADLVTVIIAVDNHEHNGIAIPKHGKIEVERETAQWMLDNHIIEG